ncbi:MAG: GGDEF domain-containing protein [Spirochaetia bacterium]|nr:GGDEF domain-containing protein [Spirochaetia bacterium]
MIYDKNIPIGNWMITDVNIITGDTSVEKAIKLMNEKNVSYVLVGTKEKPEGIFTERDVVKFFSQGQNGKKEPVKNHMSKDLKLTHESVSFEESLRIMIDEDIRHLPIISKNEIAGMVSSKELIKFKYNILEEAFHNTRRELQKTVDLLKKDSDERIQILMKDYEKLQTKAFTDDMTGLFNRRYFEDRLSEEIARSQRYGYPLSLVFLDVDDFKYYNDTNGHQKGDKVLETIGEILRFFNSELTEKSANLRKSDIVARYGGEEFIVILPYADNKEALAVAERIRVAIEKHKFEHEKKQPQGDLTISAGVATFPEMARTAEELINMADKALYHAKRTGKNKVCCFNPKKTVAK